MNLMNCFFITEHLLQLSPTIFGNRHRFRGKVFLWTGVGHGFRMIQVHYTYCALYFYYYYIDSTPDHQALDPEAGDPCSRRPVVS